MTRHSSYVVVAFGTELTAYVIILISALTVPLDSSTYYPPSISGAFASSVGLTLFYVATIYVFAVERNVYEFYIDIHERESQVGILYYAIWTRIALSNGLMLFLFYIGSVTNERNQTVHNVNALCAVVSHLLLEATSISIRLQGKRDIMRCSFLALEMSMVFSAIIFGLCFIDIIPTCPSASPVSSVAEYFLFLIVVVTPVFRLLDVYY